MVCSKCGKKINAGYVKINGKPVCSECNPGSTDPITEKIANSKNGMFGNVGGKIKAVSKVVCWLGIIASVLSGFIVLSEGIGYRADKDLLVIGILIILIGSLASWIGSFITYGFGQLVENTSIQTELLSKLVDSKESSEE